ncbi:hypothetical protein [Natranaerobius trueperi]|uniref:Uncharacterized protein n=1 Tax=Natranaerobius trueperi TaxID=759412 RepID=A0A226BVC8_9FIRM|nr:hypothetical protein [Natranaerobius trueperi]OWZ82956.1 hypothetical protein CDO51_11275 [Natranaerobius trueperi]
MRINENRLPTLLNQINKIIKVKLSNNKLIVLDNEENQNILVDEVNEYTATLDDDGFKLIFLKDDKIFSGKLLNVTDDVTFIPLFQKGYQNLTLGAIKSIQRDKFKNILLLCLSKENNQNKLLFWEYRNKWLGPFAIDTAEELILTNSSIQVDKNNNIHLLYISKNGRQEQLLHRQYTSEKKWSNPVVVSQNQINKDLNEPILLDNTGNLTSFWVTTKGNKKSICSSVANLESNIWDWSEPEVLKTISDERSLVYLSAGLSKSKPWIVFKTSESRSGLIKENNNWKNINLNNSIREMRVEGFQTHSWGQRGLGDVNHLRIWQPEMGVNQEQDAKKQVKTKNQKQLWNAGPSPQSPKSMLVNNLKKKGVTKKQASTKNGLNAKKLGDKEVIQLKKKVKSLRVEVNKLQDKYDKLLERTENLEHQFTKKFNSSNNKQDNEKSWWSKLFK